ncbi:MAG: hypothetical protein M1827_002932 [Pycnora praestabilis]|nr:MAG: hypothetical protein M1827_002932 [Pycnora praestabilis]
MQKVIRRTALAKAQAARRALKHKQKSAADQRKINEANAGVVRQQISQDIRIARLTRREDWELGPLAPRRDVGDKKETYGTVDPRRLQSVDKPRSERTTKVWSIVPGDRVVLVEGRDKGKIGVVESINKKTDELNVKGLNMVDVAVPAYMLRNEADKRAVRAVESAIPLSSVRLIFALEDPETGIKRDVIVKKVVNGPLWRDRHAGVHFWSRYIPGLNVRIPWPAKEPKEEKEHSIDTLRMKVEEKTWVPTLLRPPMPGSVIDELRNKYSVFRERHDEEYIREKMAEDEEKEKKKKMIELMRTPLKEINRRERKLRKLKGKGKLTTEMLARIGELMAKKRARTTQQQVEVPT